MDLNIIWFFLIGVLLIGYAILDGFDLGVGILQLFCKKENEKVELLKSIAPFWDGNEVWLLTGGGALFAAFPHAYASVFSGFYLAMMLLLVGLIFRALSIEFRDQVASYAWKHFWDKAFSVSSLVVALLLGVALGNVVVGIPLNSEMDYTGSFFTLLRPVPLLIGITGVFMMTLQGATYLQLKTVGELYQKANNWARFSWKAFVILLLILIVGVAFLYEGSLFYFVSKSQGYPVILLMIVSIWMTRRSLNKKYDMAAFLFSSGNIISMFLIVAVLLFPNIVNAIDPENSLTIYNASSSRLTLKTMLIIALIGMPIVIAYTTYIYRVFRFKKVYQ